MNILKEYSGRIQFMFMRVNAHIVNVRIFRLKSLEHIPSGVSMKLFNELGINTNRDYVSISHETAETLIGLLTTLGIRYSQSTGN